MLVLGCEEKAPPTPVTKAPTPAPKAPQVAPSAAPTGQVPPIVPAPTGAGQAAQGGVRVLGLNFDLPANWKQVPPGNQMRLAEVQVPDASGDAAKVCTVVFSTAGGDVESNIARWAGQVKDEAGQPSKYQDATKTVAGMTVHTVEMTGAFANMGETTPHQNWMLRGSVVETPGGLLFVKMTGPREQMAAAAGAYAAMIEGMKK